MDDEATLALYDRRRACSRALHNELFAASGKEVMMAAGRRLGIVQKGVFVFDTEDESAILADACLYAVRDEHGESAVQRVARSGRYPEGSLEPAALDAMSRARFSLFTLTDGVPGVWIAATDALTGHTSRIVDRGLSMSPTMMFASRLVDYPEFAVTTGAGIPIPTRDVFDGLAHALGAKGLSMIALREPDAPTKLRDDFYYATMSHLLHTGMLRRTRYIDPTNPEEVASLDEGSLLDPYEFGRPQLPVTREGPKVGRNEPCPCGSGKKYKKCHGG